MSIVVESSGWIGAFTVLAAYLLSSAGKLRNGAVYQLLNLVGGACITVNVAAHHAWPSTIVNAVWAVIAVVVLGRMALARRRARRAADPVAGEGRGTPATPRTIAGADVTPPEPAAGRAPRTASIPMVDSLPAVTAALTIALVAAAMEERAITASVPTASIATASVPTTTVPTTTVPTAATGPATD